MIYDDAAWHYEGEFPAELPAENGGTHIGMFLAWIIMRGLEGQRLSTDAADALDAVRGREITGRVLLFRECDEKLTEDDLNHEARRFAESYYMPEEQSLSYLDDYSETLDEDLPSLYHVADTWENYDRLAPVIDRRFTEWKARRTDPG